MSMNSSLWVRRVYPSNPAYLFSAVLVLWGLNLGFQGRDTATDAAWLTLLLCGYSLAVALVGIMVIRLGQLWEDARTVLLVLLLMFTALSTVFDSLCLNQWPAGAACLGFGLAFSVVVSEAVLRSLNLKLPAAFRAPLYLQLAVLFAFPPLLGYFSLDGRSDDMVRGVLSYCVAAGVATLCLAPAALRGREALHPAGSNWRWPFYPWSPFVLLIVASAMRTWMLCVSFSPAKGADSAFLPLLLCPIAAATAAVLLVLGVRNRSLAIQKLALFGGVAVPVAATLPSDLNPAQTYLLGVVQAASGSPLVIALGFSAALGLAGAAARRVGGEALAAFSLAAMLSLNAGETSLRGAWPLSAAGASVMVGWMAARWAYSRHAAPLVGGVALGLIGWRSELASLLELGASSLQTAYAVTILLLATPLVCRDRVSRALRPWTPLALAVTCMAFVTVYPAVWPVQANWSPPVAAAVLAVGGGAYFRMSRDRWAVASLVVCLAVAGLAALQAVLVGLASHRLREGLQLYAMGVCLLGFGVLVSLCKAGFAWRLLDWLSAGPASAAPIPQPASPSPPPLEE
ncbi:hypothetical protein Pla123a_34260 [Posidoniimonas polymericola]|uniref:Uncharacterized protein n=1 Tax=Posidoniimonas polymericola TaxID=2528002 RepID=A0A5C5YIA5_9BACT|nr:hypothetical protein [Posidoniimonas polymericola]TWT74602.1 hypothetical protein Pla123a_34260 [Posidoniimonas polymericola]